MKLAAISDIHGSYRQLPPMDAVDVLIVAGDFLGQGKFHELQDFDSWIRGQRADHKIVVAGNHDIVLEELAAADADGDIFGKEVHYLRDAGVTIDGVKFWGSPWTPLFYDWSFMKEDAELALFWDKIPADVDVLITHGPPKDSLDYVRRGGNVGSQTLADRIGTRCHPRIHIFGHIHEWGGRARVKDGIAYFNVAALDPYYQPRPGCWTYVEV